MRTESVIVRAWCGSMRPAQVRPASRLEPHRDQASPIRPRGRRRRRPAVVDVPLSRVGPVGESTRRFLVVMWPEPELPIDLREAPSVTLVVRDDDLISDIAERTQRESGLDWSLGWEPAFLTTPDHEGRTYQDEFLSWHVDEEGHVVWNDYLLQGVRVADLLRTARVGLFRGDPLAILIREFRGGNGVLLSWDDVLNVLAHIGVLYGGVKGIAESASVVANVVRRYHQLWLARHAQPSTAFEFLLKERAWDYTALAKFLEVPFDVCVDLLTGLGFEQDRNEPLMYRRSDSAPGAKVRDEIRARVLHGIDPASSRDKMLESQRHLPK
jgi:hypothetical protein